MPKSSRGGKRRGGAGGGANWDANSVNPYQIPQNLADAIGTKGKELSMSDAYFGVNPYYSDTYKEFSENCQRCVLAYEMRRRGYDVEALPTYQGDTMPRSGNWTKALSGMTSASVGRTTERATLNAIVKQMETWGEGSRAILRLKWAGGTSGHVINVEYTNGKLYAWDAQNSKSATGTTLLKDYLQYTTLSRTELLRTDNATVTDDMRYMVKKK